MTVLPRFNVTEVSSEVRNASRYRLTINLGDGDTTQLMLDEFEAGGLLHQLARALGQQVSPQPDYGTPRPADHRPVPADVQDEVPAEVVDEILTSQLTSFSRMTRAAMGLPPAVPVPAETDQPEADDEDERGYWWRRLKSPTATPLPQRPVPARSTMETELDRIRDLYRDGETP